MTAALWVAALAILNISLLLSRFLKPAKTLADVSEKLLEEHQRTKLELAKAAEEISLIRKRLERNS